MWDYLTVALSFCLYFFDSNVLWYAALSGLLHGLFAWSVTGDIHARQHIGALMLYVRRQPPTVD